MKTIIRKALALGLLLYSLYSGLYSHAQEGNPFLTHFKLPNHISNQNWRFEQSDNGLMFILNQKGIFAFDGFSWDNMGVIGRPVTMRFFKGNLYFCSDRGVGRFIRESTGIYRPEILLESKQGDFFYKFSLLNDTLFVASPQLICRIMADEAVRIDTLYSETYKEVFISDIFPLKNQLYHVKNRALVYRPKVGGGFEMVDGLAINEDFIFSLVHNNEVFLGSTANRLYRLTGSKLERVNLKDQEYIKASQLNGGVSIDPETIALSTLNGGCILIKSADGSTVHTLNLSQGLPDDEVYGLGRDRDGGLWIAHAMGISRADTRIPVRSFNFYPGLKGNVFSCVEHGGKLYVGCSDGLFVLTEFKDFKEVEVTVRQPKKEVKKEEVEAQEIVQPTEEGTAVEKKKKNFLTRLFSRKSSTEPDEEMVRRQKEDAASQQVAEISHVSPLKKKIYQLQSVSHNYRKISGIDGKVRQLFIYQQSLFAATSSGLYEIIGENSRVVVPGMYVVFAQGSKHLDNTILLTSDRGAHLLVKSGNGWQVRNILSLEGQIATSIIDVDKSMLLVTSDFDVYLLKKENGEEFSSTLLTSGNESFDSPMVRRIHDNIFVFTLGNTFLFNADNQSLIEDNRFQTDRNVGINFSQQEYTWLRTTTGWQLFGADDESKYETSPFINLFDNPISFFVYQENLYVVNNYSQVLRVKQPTQTDVAKPLGVFLKDVSGKEGNLIDPGSISLTYSENSLRIRISAPYFVKESAVLYQYMIKGLTNSWSEWDKSQLIDLPYLPSGKYSIQIRAKDALGNMSEILEIPYAVTPPFWKRPIFFVVCAFIILILFVLVVYLRERNLKREKEILEEKVRERTQTIEEQNITLTLQRDTLERNNREIMQQKEEIMAQRDEIEAQRDKIFKQNEEITHSIVYARRIQAAVMPSMDVMKSLIPTHFLLFRPRDIVSGDFYWMSKRNDKIIVVASDCTGHGVPGAFMSMMGVSFLNDIVNVNGETRPDFILNQLREKIKTTLWQTGKEGETRDGMDIAICVFEPDGKSVSYAGAYNSLYLVRQGELIEYKADKMPVGIHVKEKDSFTSHSIDLQKADNIYIFSDGYVSQFGGDEGKKFMAKPFKDLLASLSGKPLIEQKQKLEEALDKWQRHYEQVDDILVIGIEIQG